MCFFSSFSSFNDEKFKVLYNKRITTRDNGNVESNDQEESKLSNTINASSAAQTITITK